MANLYELTADWLQFQNALENGNDEDYVAAAMEALNDEIEAKADGYARIIRNFEKDIDGFKAEEKRLKDKRVALENSVNRLKDDLQNAMIATGKRKFKTEFFSFAIQKNGGALPVIVDVPTEELEDQFVIVTEKPDLKAIAAYIEETGDITKFHFGERGESLRIK